MERPIIVITGACGFVGRHLISSLKEEFRIIGVDWRSQEQGSIPKSQGVRWAQADITDMSALTRALGEVVSRDTRPDLVLHLAAYYDFEGETHREHYWRTNVVGTRNMLDLCESFGIPRFVLASSLAACRFPAPGETLDESSPPDGDHIYAQTKAAAEAMLAEYRSIHSLIVRFAAMFSDFCEYPPLFEFLQTWLSPVWNSRVLGGAGRSAIPYLHIRDAVRLLRAMLHRFDDLEQRAVIVASPDGSTSHKELFRTATAAYYGAPKRPIHVPKILVRPGIWARLLWGRLLGSIPFERPWMADYVDLAMNADSSRTRALLDWQPIERLAILRRLPLMIDNYSSYPGEWSRLNQGASHKSFSRPNLVIHDLIRHHQTRISERLTHVMTEKYSEGQFSSYVRLAEGERAWNHHLALTQLMSSVATRQRSFFVDYCRNLAQRRFEAGFKTQEVTTALRELERVIIEVLREDEASQAIEDCIPTHLSMTVQFAIDEVEYVFDELQARRASAASPSPFSHRQTPSTHEESQQTHDQVTDEGERHQQGRV